jgi:pyruvate dehydrogenase E2 component (dihydrolipoamide acetyltransferase)
VSQTIDIQIPDIGDFSDVPVIDVLVREGETVEVDTPLITLETEKATLDVPSTAAGVVKALKIAKGEKVSRGSVILTLETAEAAPAPKAPESPPEPTIRQPTLQVPSPPSGGEGQGEGATFVDTVTIKTPSPQPSPPHGGEGAGTAHASPSVRKFARELGVDLARVSGSGIKGRITPEDVKAFVKKVMTGGAQPGAEGAPGAGLPKVPAVDFARFGPVEVQPLGRIQRISGPRLHASWVNVPHVTQFDQADITELEETRGKLKAKAESQGIKLTPLAFVIRACARAIREYPMFNTSLDASGENLVHKKYLHIGFAADTPGGLVVPVIRDADRKDIYELARDLADLSAKARAGKLGGTQMQGGCFTVSSLGSIGGTAFTPIINAPEVAILGVSRADHRPVYRDGGFVPRLMLPLSLSYDHRVIDGALAVRFTTYLSKALADVGGLLEAIP